MTNRENYLSIARRTGYSYMPVYFRMCPSLTEKFKAYIATNPLKIPCPEVSIKALPAKVAEHKEFMQYYRDTNFKPGTTFDRFGIAREPGSAAAFHMTRMYHPMESLDSVEQILTYPLPDYTETDLSDTFKQVKEIHAADMMAVGRMTCTIWETSWYLRGMENLMCDMINAPQLANTLLDRVTDIACFMASSFAACGADVIVLGDDIGTQRAIMMSVNMYDEWLKPRLARVIAAAKAQKPDILIMYHSCGYIKELIPSLIDAGIDILNPVQPECMAFEEIHAKFGDHLSFHGTLGTQTVMPFGTPEDVRREVFKNLDIAGSHGGLFICPTHLLEPEVPPKNVAAYIRACIDYMN